MTSFYLVAGLGKTGHSIARYLKRHQQAFAVFDTRTAPTGLDEFHTEFPDIEVFLGEVPAELINKVTAVITSPGVDLTQASMQQIKAAGITIYGDIECFAREVHAPIIAITGTNGKSTVTTLVGEMAKAAGISVAVAGNIGTPVLDLLDNQTQYDLWVLELSSFQLDLTTSLAPLAATILNITPDHLDRHHTFNAYVQAKQCIYDQAQYVLYNREDQLTHPRHTLSNATVTSFGLDKPAQQQWGLQTINQTTYLAYGEQRLIAVDELKIKGRHNWANALAACALAHAAKIPFENMLEVLRSFTGLPHRCQWVRTLDSVDWINDSKGTNVGATISAISGIGGAIDGKIVLIAGGQGKGADFRELRVTMQTHVRALVLIGEDANKFQDALHDVVTITHAKTFDEAINQARSAAKPGDVVLLSPACASFDMFRDFNQRGEIFQATVAAL